MILVVLPLIRNAELEKHLADAYFSESQIVKNPIIDRAEILIIFNFNKLFPSLLMFCIALLP